MDRKSIIILVVCFILLILWQPLVVNKLYPPKPPAPGLGTNAPMAAPAGTNAPALAPAPAPSAPMAETPARTVLPGENTPEETLTLTNANARYTFTSRGGGLKLVELQGYPETVSRKRGEQPKTNRVATLNTFAPTPAMTILGSDALIGDGIFKLSNVNGAVRAEKVLSNGLAIIKEFQPSTNYLLGVSVRFENRSSQPLVLPAQQMVVGTATPMGPLDNGTLVGVMWYNGQKSATVDASFFSSRGFACMPRVPPPEYRAGASNVLWTAVYNQFFTLATMTATNQPAAAVVVHPLTLPRMEPDADTVVATNSAPPQGYEAALVYPGATLAAGQALERKLFVYGGPKEYRTLARLGNALGNNLDAVMKFGWAGFISKALLLSMNWLHGSLMLSYGWAIIAITVIIKLVFWPLTQASTRSMKRMQALQPQIKAIQDKYKDDPVKSQRKMMELWKEHKVSPLSGCFPMLIQIPVFFGFYTMIQTAIELRGASFMWVADLSKPDTLFYIPGTSFPFNLLPLIMGVTMLWQARLTPPSPGMDPTQAKVMKYMPVIFMVFLYNFSAGLTLYWTVQNLLTIAQTKLTRTADPVDPARPVLTPAPKKRK
jgi:YidC/Oxa1 family membrane protein insertase